MNSPSPTIKVKSKREDAVSDKSKHNHESMFLNQNDIKGKIRYKLFQTPSFKAENQGLYNKRKKKKHRMIKLEGQREPNIDNNERNKVKIMENKILNLNNTQKNDLLQENKGERITNMDDGPFNMFDLREETYKLKKKKPKEDEFEEETKQGASNKNTNNSMAQHNLIQHQFQNMTVERNSQGDIALLSNSPKLFSRLKDENILFPAGRMDMNQIYNLEESFKRTFAQLNLLDSSQDDKDWEKEYDVQKKLKTGGKLNFTHSDSEPENENIESRREKSFADLKARRRKRLARMEIEPYCQNFELDSDEGFMEPQIVIQSEFQMQNEYIDNMSDEVAIIQHIRALIFQYEEEEEEEVKEETIERQISPQENLEAQLNSRPRINNPFIILRDISKEERLLALNQVQTPMQTELSIAQTDKEEPFDIVSDKVQEGN